MTMDYYSPWSEREIWLFLRIAISPKQKKLRPPKLVHMHNSSIHNCMNFLGRFRSIKFFDDHGLCDQLNFLMTMDYGRKGNLAIFENSNIPETEEATSIKIGAHA